MPPLAAFISFRFSPTDGVSAVTRTWITAFESLGFETLTVSGETGSDVVVPGLGLVTTGRDISEIASDLSSAIEGADLIIAENLLTIPMNLDASAAALRVLRGRRTLVHHHDPPWHRERFRHITDLPVDSPGWRHVSINRVLQHELADRGIASTLIYNGFEIPDPEALNHRESVREQVRSKLSVSAEETLVVHPVRAIERKNIPEAIALCESLGATYWLTGPPEEDYADELDRLLGSARCRVIHRSASSTFNMYAAADHVTFPSTWEGFGNPPIEAALHRRSVSVGRYPVGGELRELGFIWADSSRPSQVKAMLDPANRVETNELLDHNERIARSHFSFERMTESLERLLSDAGWLP